MKITDLKSKLKIAAYDIGYDFKSLTEIMWL